MPAAVDLHLDELVLAGRIAQQVQPVADQPVVAPLADVVVAVQEFLLAAKQIVLGELEFATVQAAAAGPGTAGGPDLAAIDDVLLVDDHGRVEVVIRQAREGIAVRPRAVPVRWPADPRRRPRTENSPSNPSTIGRR